MPMLKVILMVIALAIPTLGHATQKWQLFSPPPNQATLNSGEVKVITGDHYRFHVLKDKGGYTATIIESVLGSMLVDTGTGKNPQFGEDINTYLTLIGKPVSTIITHEHSDHYGNLDKIDNIEVIYAEAYVAADLNQSDKFHAITKMPVTALKGKASLYGLIYDFHTIDNAETDHNSYFAIESAKGLFVGDLLYVDAYNYIREYTPLDDTDELTNWIETLQELKLKYSEYDYVFVGHNGYSDNIQALADQNIHYLSIAQALIKGKQPLPNGKKATNVTEVVAEMFRLFPNYKGKGLGFALPGSFWAEDPGAKWF